MSDDGDKPASLRPLGEAIAGGLVVGGVWAAAVVFPQPTALVAASLISLAVIIFIARHWGGRDGTHPPA